MPPTPIIGYPDEALCQAFDCFEGNLDTQYITAIAPKTTTYLGYQYSIITWLAGLTILPVLPRVASISYGGPEPYYTTEHVALFDVEAIKLSAMGVTIVAASGDDGASSFLARGDPAYCGYAASYPASSQYVLAVGATSGPGILFTKAF